LQALNKTMSEAIAQQHRRKSALCSLTADARLADLLRRSADELARRGLRSDRIDLRLSRAEIGQQLGMTLECVSRAFSRLARERLIHFPDNGRREVAIPDMKALAGFVQRATRWGRCNDQHAESRRRVCAFRRGAKRRAGADAHGRRRTAGDRRPAAPPARVRPVSRRPQPRPPSRWSAPIARTTFDASQRQMRLHFLR
jgi:hypothetical protein